MMTEFALRYLYGAIVISSGFLIGSMGRLAGREFQRIGFAAAMRSVYFWLAANLACSSAALVVICGIRTYDAFHGVIAGRNWGWLLVVGFGVLFLSKVGFNWAGSMTLKHGRQIWWSMVLSLTVWLVALAAWTSGWRP